MERKIEDIRRNCKIYGRPVEYQMKICKKSQAKPDRIAIAYRLRLDIHAYIKANEGCTIRAIIDAFPDRSIETVRKSIYRLRVAEEIDTIEVPSLGGRRHICRTMTAEIKAESETRKRLAMPKKTSKKPSDKTTGLVYASDGGRILPEDEITKIDPQRPWRTVHRGSMRERNLPGQRGQGAC
jgi:hypothetical protein